MVKIVQEPKQTKARKYHKCMLCLKPIEKGAEYLNSVYVYDDIYSFKEHLHCSGIAKKLNMFDNCDEGLTSEDFHIEITEEYYNITKIPYNTSTANFSEKLDVVLAFHK